MKVSNKTILVFLVFDTLITYSFAIENTEYGVKNRPILNDISMIASEMSGNTDEYQRQNNLWHQRLNGLYFSDIHDDSIRNSVDSNSVKAQDSQMADDASVNSLSERKIKKPWPTGALLRSAILPGWGQLYNKKYIKAIVYGGTEIYLLYKVRQLWLKMDKHQKNFQNSDDPVYKAKEFSLYEKSRDNRNIHLWLTGLTIFISMFDAYVDAHLADFGQTDKSFEVYITPEADLIEACLVYNF